MIPVIKIVRPVNLLIIALTMYGSKLFISKQINVEINGYPIAFLLLVVSTLFIAAAGNIINDYFDVKADRINKPNRLIINKSLKSRWAIVLHWIFNFIGFFMAIVLAIHFKSLWFVLIHLASINLLWFYSLFLKKKAVLGNLVIGFLTALIPILVIIYFQLSKYKSQIIPLENEVWYQDSAYQLIWVLSIFAFFQNFAREILKDIQDMKGDEKIYVRSLPMIIGVNKTKLILCAILILSPIFYLLTYLSNQFLIIGLTEITSLGLAIASILNLVVIIRLISFSKENLIFEDAIIKLAMLFGLITTFHAALTP